MHEIPQLDKHGLRNFAFVTGTAIIVLFGFFFPWLLDRVWPLWPWVLASVLVFWGLLAPESLRPVYYWWMRFGLLLNRIMTPLILGIIFFLLIVPMAMAMRLRGRDTMRRKFEPNTSSYRVSRLKPPKDKMERPF